MIYYLEILFYFHLYHFFLDKDKQAINIQDNNSWEKILTKYEFQKDMVVLYGSNKLKIIIEKFWTEDFENWIFLIQGIDKFCLIIHHPLPLPNSRLFCMIMDTWPNLQLIWNLGKCKPV